MRLLIVLCLTLIFATSASVARGETIASRVFAVASPSIVVVEAFDAKGHALEQGSGVVIANGVVVSNCHVFENADTNSAIVFYGKRGFSATLRYGDLDHDLCSLTVKGLPAPPISMGMTADLQVGQDAYAIGAPEGLELTLSSGLISSLRKMPDGVVIQMTTPISPGSSGGGLFDSQGRLIGITSYYAKQGEQLNFALPVEWIKALPHRGKTPALFAKESLGTDKAFRKGEQAFWSGDYATALDIFMRLAERGYAPAQYSLGAMYHDGQGVPQNYVKAHAWYQQAAAQGYAVAQFSLGLMYDVGQGVPQNNIEALYWYKKAARQGDPAAQSNLGTMYASGNGVPQNYVEAFHWINKAALQGDAEAEFNVGLMYFNGQGVPQNYSVSLYWYTKAATQGLVYAQYNLGQMYANGQGAPQNYSAALDWYMKAATQGSDLAQYELSRMYYDGQGVEQDIVRAAKWLILAKAGGNKRADAALPLVEEQMSASQIAEAQQKATQWYNDHHNRSDTHTGTIRTQSSKNLPTLQSQNPSAQIEKQIDFPISTIF